jgi:putative thioredoxin
VKVDTDSNQQLARSFGIQGIPAVKAFRDGKVVAEFVGAQPPPVVATFLDGLLPNEADALVANGDEHSLQQALALEPNRLDALLPLARLLMSREETDQAAQLLARAPGSFVADGLLARIELEAAGTPDLTAAFAALDSADQEQALELLLDALPGANEAKDRLRRVIVGVLDELGADSELARASRRRLAAALY